MTLIRTIDTATQFKDAFHYAGRSDQFSRSALEALFTYYDDRDEQVELDVVAICCDWCEYDSAVDACEELGLHPDDDDADDEEREEAAIEALQDESSWIIVTDSGSVLVSAS